MVALLASKLAKFEAVIRSLGLILALASCQTSGALADCGYPAHALLQLTAGIAVFPSALCAVLWAARLRSRGCDALLSRLGCGAAIARLVFGSAANCVTRRDDLRTHAALDAASELSTIIFAYMAAFAGVKRADNSARIAAATLLAAIVLRIQAQAMINSGWPGPTGFWLFALTAKIAECWLLWALAPELRNFSIHATIPGSLPLYEGKHSKSFYV